MNEWVETTLGEVLTLQRGFDLPKQIREEGSIPIVSSSGVSGFHSMAKVTGPGVVTGRYGTLGEVFYLATDFWPLNTTLWVKDFKRNDPRFISFFLRTLNLAHQNAAGAVPGINRNALHLLPVRVPPPSAQRQIANILSAYDDLIENNTRRIRILEEMAQMLYREWFVNFRFPGHQKVRMVESELGPIPEGSCTKRLGDVLTLKYGKALKDSNRQRGPVPVYGSSGLIGYHSESLSGGPGIIVGRKGNVGSVHFCAANFWVIDTAYYVHSELSLHFLYFNLRAQNFLNNDAAVPGLNRNQAHSLPIVVPMPKVLTEFERIVKPMFELKRCHEARNRNLRATRDLLLPKLISGEISVEAADESTEASA